MSQKAAKIAKNKHGVKVMGLKADPSVSPSISKPTKPDFAKKKFKTRTSKRYRSSLMGSASIPASTSMETQEEDVNVDEVITTAVNSILKETAAKVMGSDVEPDVTTSGTSENPTSKTPIPESVVEPSLVQSVGEKEVSESKDEAEKEMSGSDSSKGEEEEPTDSSSEETDSENP